MNLKRRVFEGSKSIISFIFWVSYHIKSLTHALKCRHGYDGGYSFSSLLTLDMSTVQRNHPALMENNLLALVGSLVYTTIKRTAASNFVSPVERHSYIVGKSSWFISSKNSLSNSLLRYLLDYVIIPTMAHIPFWPFSDMWLEF